MAWGASLVWETGFVPPPFYTDHTETVFGWSLQTLLVVCL
jgi:hypothetical protein